VVHSLALKIMHMPFTYALFTIHVDTNSCEIYINFLSVSLYGK